MILPTLPANVNKIETLYYAFQQSSQSALQEWREQFMIALEAWNLDLVEQLVALLKQCEVSVLGQAYAKMGDGVLIRWQEDNLLTAQTVWEQADRLFDKTDDVKGHCLLLMSLGSWYSDKQQWEQAITTYEKACEMYDRQGNQHGVAQIWANLGTVYQAQGRWGLALNAFRRSLNVFLEVNDFLAAAVSLGGMGEVLLDLGVYEEAVECYQVCLEIFSDAGNVSGQLDVLNNLGRLYEAVGQPKRALTYFQKGLVLGEQIGHWQKRAVLLGNLGGVLYGLGQYDEAQMAYEESYKTYLTLADQHGMSISHNELGNLYRHLGKYEMAQTHLMKARTLKQEIQDERGLLHVLLNLAWLSVHQDRWEEMIGYATEAEELATKWQLDQYLATAQLLLGIATLKTGNISLAADHLAQAALAGWGHNDQVGQEVCDQIIHLLNGMIQEGKRTIAQRIGKEILQAGNGRLTEMQLQGFVTFLKSPEKRN